MGIGQYADRAGPSIASVQPDSPGLTTQVLDYVRNQAGRVRDITSDLRGKNDEMGFPTLNGPASQGPPGSRGEKFASRGAELRAACEELGGEINALHVEVARFTRGV
jgi:hypothetical protein